MRGRGGARRGGHGGRRAEGAGSPVARRPRGQGPGGSGSEPGRPPALRPARPARALPGRGASPGRHASGGHRRPAMCAPGRHRGGASHAHPTPPTHEGGSAVAPGGLSPLPRPLGGGGWSEGAGWRGGSGGRGGAGWSGGAEFCLGTLLAPPGASVGRCQPGVRSLGAHRGVPHLGPPLTSRTVRGAVLQPVPAVLRARLGPGGADLRPRGLHLGVPLALLSRGAAAAPALQDHLREGGAQRGAGGAGPAGRWGRVGGGRARSTW